MSILSKWYFKSTDYSWEFVNLNISGHADISSPFDIQLWGFLWSDLVFSAIENGQIYFKIYFNLLLIQARRYV